MALLTQRQLAKHHKTIRVYLKAPDTIDTLAGSGRPEAQMRPPGPQIPAFLATN